MDPTWFRIRGSCRIHRARPGYEVLAQSVAGLVEAYRISSGWRCPGCDRHVSRRIDSRPADAWQRMLKEMPVDLRALFLEEAAARMARDPVYFATAIGMDDAFTPGCAPLPWQAQVLRSRHPRRILCCSRQVGKSRAISMLVLHEAIFRPYARCVLFSKTERQAKELYLRTIDALHHVPAEVRPKSVEENKTSLTLENGSRIIVVPNNPQGAVGIPGTTLLIEDEACYVPDQTHALMSPLLAASHGRMVLLSTPSARIGHFFEIWHDDRDDSWERTSVTAAESPWHTPEFLAAEKRRLPDLEYRTQYLNEFVNAEDGVFTEEEWASGADPEIEAISSRNLLDA